MTARQFKLIKFRRAIKLFTDRAAKKKMYAIFFLAVLIHDIGQKADVTRRREEGDCLWR